MNRPPLEVADIVRAQGNRFIENHSRWIHWTHCKVLQAIAACRTAILGGHRDQCSRCGYRAISYNSCRNRHCPKCQNGARDKWIAARQNDLLAVAYVHVVFTLPQQLSHLMLQNKKALYDLLFRASAETLLEVARDPKHLGAEIGFLSVLHTWGQNLLHHPHIHCVIPAGGLKADHSQWVHPRYRFFLPVGVLSKVFRGKFVAGLKRAFQQGRLTFAGTLKPLEQDRAFRSFLRTLFRHPWVVYAKPPFGGPQHVIGYLARYTHRVAISNHRLVAFQDDQVTFRWKDYAHGNRKKMMTLSSQEFLRRFLLHVLPRGFVRIRSFGFLANRCRATLLPHCRLLLLNNPKPHIIAVSKSSPAQPALFRCPLCASPMITIETFPRCNPSTFTIRGPNFDSS
jgi:predicted Zn-ribbon and HTH transcriptional regulator